MRVVVVAAGIGGLALAQGLRRAGADVQVYDRDSDVAATGGYRLHLDSRACAALRRQLPPALLQAVQASSAGSAAFRQFAITDHGLRPLVVGPEDRAAERLLIGRIPLRRLLAHGLGDALHFGAEFTHHRTSPDGRVTAHFADGSSTEADLLVGADGVGSRVARALAGRTTSARARAQVPALLRAGPALAFAPDGVGLFLSLHDPSAGMAVDPETCREVPADLEEPTLIWGLFAADARYPPDIRDLAGQDLTALAATLLARWAPGVRALVEAGDPTTPTFYRFHAADPDAGLTPWPAGTVTCLGDAVHAMPPTGGQAAATAIRDADLLTRHLATVRAGASTVPLAVHSYQTQMAAYATDAVRESLAPVRWLQATDSPAVSAAARVALPLSAVARGYRRIRPRPALVTATTPT